MNILTNGVLGQPISEAKRLFKKLYLNNNYNILKYRSDIALALLIEENNIHLDAFPFRKESFCGMLVIDEFETTITYNSNHSPEKQHFTIAHELGHYYLHRNKQSQFVDQAKDMLDNSIFIFEQQANAFAAELLLPDDVISLMLSYRYNYYRIAKTTRISYECLYWRLVNYLSNKLDLLREQSIAFVEDYKKHSANKEPENAAIFRVAFNFGYTGTVHKELLRLTSM
ncbi:ImmA/IrrE family metallo-endopeptidase [Paenibacillus alvei]|uniref:ImmA/IrrE family metallo-endopeptidase n=1 Tax=Paenibacillus alvei TaxID=44250 RepID=A0ABT4H769_PAEAL|nr:ImmA/IrrE family metallo-endopeptidase [Paenibacillus alvei]MCY9764809.1 ImmA/IrrE family metallo-endopeptidase [Paenibacillus alvei]MCY9770716.1 ImmA/IrrE family metallo-endopeptidase [Paenibacillus alvei]